MRTDFGWLIGDPHLGRKFEVGVPIHRRGEREWEQLALFVDELQEPGELVVMVGDLFDHPYVPHLVVKQAIDAALTAAAQRPDTQFVFMAGNHDMPRKITATGAFDIFKRACNLRYDNLAVLTVPAIIKGVAFFPWEWDCAAIDQVPKEKWNVEAVVGHWDLASYGGDDSHLAPVAALRHAFGSVPLYSGHYHTSGDYTVEGVTVHCTGSLQPLTHAEDPEGLIYVTVDRSDLDNGSPADFRDKCVRVRLKPGEDLPSDLDARSVIGQRIAGQTADAGQAVTLDKFDWSGIVARSLAPLDQEVRAFIEERLPSHGTTNEH